jgi:hypothetical protein
MNERGLGLAALATLALSSQAGAAMPSLEFSGAVEVEASSSEDYAGASRNDIAVATVAMGVDVTLNERVSSHVAFLYEEDDTDFGVDEATITLGLSDAAAVTAGKMYVPFGRYDSLMVSDPQTLEMGETVETVLMLSMENKGFYGSVYLFNGDSEEASTVASGDDDDISSGFDLGYAMDERFDISVSYISNIADSEALQALEDSGSNVGEVDSKVAGGSISVMASYQGAALLAEHVMALESFSNGDLDGTVTNEEQPTATNIELGFDMGNSLMLAAAYQMTDEARFIGLPEKTVSAAVSYEVLPGASLAAEYATMEDYAVSDGGSGETATAITMQLAVEF